MNLYREWHADPRRQDVAPAVLSHRTEALLEVSPTDIEAVARRTEHALGDVRKDFALSVPEIQDWHPDFAITHVFAFIVEDLGTFPTFGQFRDRASESPFDAMLWKPAQRAIAEAVSHGGHSQAAARAAMRWRIGNAYYSFMREAYVMARLRESGVAVRSHPLADALFRVDFWQGDVNVDLFVSNRVFRSGLAGRKARSADLLADASPPFVPVRIEMPTATKFGVVHLPDPGAIASAAERMHRAAVSR